MMPLFLTMDEVCSGLQSRSGSVVASTHSLSIYYLVHATFKLLHSYLISLAEANNGYYH